MKLSPRALGLVSACLLSGCAPGGEKAIAVGKPQPGFSGPALSPIKYQAELHVSPLHRTFEGQLTVLIQARRATSEIKLDAAGLSFKRVRIVPARKVTLHVDEGAQQLRVAFNRPLEPGRWKLSIEYSGRVGSAQDMIGLFSTDPSFVVTQFQPNGARRVFPCFDHPRFRAPWTLSVVTDQGSKAFSNTVVARTDELGDGRVRFVFKETVPIPSYLVALAVGKLEEVRRESVRESMRFLFASGEEHAGQRVLLDEADEMLQFLANYLGTPVPAQKIDFLEVPYFRHAGMENFGLITLNSNLVSWRDSSQERFMLGVLAHELAHLWFGGQVTPESWRYLWLSEGMAGWLEAKTLRRAYGLSARDGHEVLRKHYVLRRNATATSRRWQAESTLLESQQSWSGETREVVSTAVTIKGAEIVRMLEHHVGQADFRTALREFLSAHKDGVAGTTDVAELLSAYERGAGETIASYVTGEGVPHLRFECNNERRQAVVSTKVRRAGTLFEDTEQEDVGWVVPVCIKSRAGETCRVLTPRQRSLSVSGIECSDWIYPNAGERGFYSWSMPPRQIRQLLGQLEDLTERELVGLVLNLRAAFEDREVEAGEVLEALEILSRKGALAPAVIAALLQSLERFSAVLVDRPIEAAFSRYAQRVLAPQLRVVGIEARDGESLPMETLRPRFLVALGILGNDASVQSRAARLIRQSGGISGSETSYSREHAAALLALAATADDQIFAELLEQLEEGTASSVAAGALGLLRDEDRINRIFSKLPEARSESVARIFAGFFQSAALQSRVLRYYEERNKPRELAYLLRLGSHIASGMFVDELGLSWESRSPACTAAEAGLIPLLTGLKDEVKDRHASRVDRFVAAARGCAALRAAHYRGASRFLAGNARTEDR